MFTTQFTTEFTTQPPVVVQRTAPGGRDSVSYTREEDVIRQEGNVACEIT